MTPDFLRAFFQAGVFVTIVSLVLVLTVERSSAEYVVSLCSLMIGLTLMGLVVLITRLRKR
jgi:hypothetical protein